MPKPEIEEFAKVLVEQVRDAAIKGCDLNLRPGVDNVVTERWKEAARKGDLETIASVLIPDIVDEAVFQLLRSIDQDQLRISFAASTGKTVDLSKDGTGELGGWYMGSDGWRRMLSRQRFADDFADLK